MPGSTSKVIHGGVDEQTFAECFDEVQDWMAFASRLGAWHKLGHTKQFYKCAAQLHKHIDYFVNLALQQKPNDDDNDKHEFNILKGLAKVERDPLELRGQLLSILVAGRDSTASLLGWFFIMMCKNPDIFDKLRETIIRDFGDWGTCDPADITFSGLKSCTFLQMCISETLRLFPLVPINGRTAIVKDTTLPTGGGPDGTAPVFVPKGMEIQYCVHALHHRKDLWGEDAEEFRPERFKEARPGWEYLPFNGKWNPTWS
ncbi:putative cytochrome p450 52a12 [Diaporthe ampelina]|uniref:Putative cytochrome p450 52a12 n=1 Tax=Diaporthe ampelina TaxID=1214573 RepID=A0A0G2I030_9PEZI|nr:putative cytochrome p450 52a12 [Diaporthe ampelina]